MKALFASLFLLTFSANAQERLSTYQAITENRIKQSIKFQQNDKLSVANVFLSKDNQGNGKLKSYNKNDQTPFFKAIFTYDFFRFELNYSFRLFITITKSKEIEFDSTALLDLPKCFLLNTNCNLISKDSALKIAKKDSFISQNISADLLKEHKADNFFWYIVDNPKEGTPIKVFSNKSRPCLIIDAYTGKIISRNRTWTKKS